MYFANIRGGGVPRNRPPVSEYNYIVPTQKFNNFTILDKIQ